MERVITNHKGISTLNKIIQLYTTLLLHPHFSQTRRASYQKTTRLQQSFSLLREKKLFNKIFPFVYFLCSIKFHCIISVFLKTGSEIFESCFKVPWRSLLFTVVKGLHTKSWSDCQRFSNIDWNASNYWLRVQISFWTKDRRIGKVVCKWQSSLELLPGYSFNKIRKRLQNTRPRLRDINLVLP